MVSPKAGYAWSGPYSWCCEVGGNTSYVAWQILVHEREECPTSPTDFVAGLDIISPEPVQPPSTELPALRR